MTEYRGFNIVQGSDLWGGQSFFVHDPESGRTLFDEIATHAEAVEAIDDYLDAE